MSRFFECSKRFKAEIYNDKCEPTGDFFVIEKGSEWELDNYMNYGISDNHLEDIDSAMWIEIDDDYLKKYFKEVRVGMSKCKDCEYFLPKYQECECPDVSQSKAKFCLPDDEGCEYFEQNGGK